MVKSTITVILLLASLLVQAQPLSVHVRLDTSVHQPQTGRLYIFSQPDTTKGVMEPDPFTPTPTFYIDVKNWQPGNEQVLDAASNAFPVKLGALQPGYYKFSALLDVNTEERSLQAPGNYYSRDIVAEVIKDKKSDVHITLARSFRARTFKENDTLHEVVLKSNLLTKFHKKEVFLKAAIVLPHNYQVTTGKTYPVVFIIPGWGGTHYDAQYPYPGQRYGFGMGIEKIYVYLNPETQTAFGLHAFVDSKVNGPWGRALVQELVPYLQKKYPIAKDAAQHFVVGQSSGGYAALWLQLNYPQSFGGCWAVSPDPVDFSDFCGVNMYAPGVNFYYAEKGAERPFFIWEGKPISTLKAYASFENFMGDGGQLQSFEAEFGKPGKDGKPQLLFNRATGMVDPLVVKEWKSHDMGVYLQKNWSKISKYLQNKIHVYAGAEDNFFLNRSVIQFKQKADKVKATVVAELVPKANHFSVWSPEFTKRVQAEIDKLIRKSEG